MKKVRVKIKGVTPLLHHRMREEDLFSLLGTKGKKKKDMEEKTPREIAESYAYKTTDGKYYIPSEYISGAFAAVASEYKQSNSQRKSYKAIAKGIFRPVQDSATLTDHDGNPLTDFEVDIRKATNHQKGAVAVCRPRFDRWQAEFEVSIDTDLISEKTALDILNDSGKRAGIGSFRVQRGGYFGQFQVIEFS
jgi:hypothetical protein